MRFADGSAVFVIAEIGQAHDGSEGIAHSLIDAAKSAGCNAVKLQTHIAHAESSEHEPFRVKFSYQDKTRFDYWKRMEFSEEQWQRLREHAREIGLAFVSSPFSVAAVELLQRVGVDAYKVGSGEVGNLVLLEWLARSGRPVILSSGMSSYEELDRAVDLLRSYSTSFAVLQCSSKYPTSAEDIGLNVIAELRARYQAPSGLSDHSGTIHAPLAAVALGAQLVEVHFTFDRRMFGPDSPASLTVDELHQLVEGVRYIERALRHPIDKRDNSGYRDMKRVFEKSLAVRVDLRAGELIGFEHLETKKPAGLGIAPADYATVVGRRLKVDKRQNEFLKREDIE